MNDYLMRPMTRNDVDTVIDWAGLEGWNPGLNDAACFYAADPGGFFVGLLEGEPVAAISAVRYGRTFGFIGLYIVRPEHRGNGYGMKLWNTAMASLEGRNIGLDGVVEQQENYRKSGFGCAYRNIRYEGRVSSHNLAREFDMSELSTLDIGQINAYDRSCFFEERRRFTRHWIYQPGAFGFGVQADGSLKGYGVLRPCLHGFKVGPLFAETSRLADQLLAKLLACVPDGSVFYLDVPEVNERAVELAHRRGMSVVFETARMYTGEAPRLPLEKVFGVTTFELG